jgi:hypothetical protein
MRKTILSSPARSVFLQRYLSLTACWVVIATLLFTNNQYKFWKDPGRVIAYDVISYYQYLPAIFVHKDISGSFITKSPGEFAGKFWLSGTPKGGYVGRMTMGIAYLYAPFFLAAHALAGPLGYAADGFSVPYKFALILSSICYAAFGLFLLRGLLKKYFGETATALTLVVTGLATNLFFYTVIEPPMSHAYSFFLFCAFLFLLDRWLDNPHAPGSLMLGAVSGLILLIRPTNIIVLLFFLLWGVGSLHALKARALFLGRSLLPLLLVASAAFLVILPQMLYWKYVTGSYIYNSYRDQNIFFFGNPQFINGLFSYRKGWLLYTPVMVFALLGIVVLFYRRRMFFASVLAFTVINLYIIFSWWQWWYGGGFGQRSLIESYAIMALPLAAMTEWALSGKRFLKAVYLSLLGFFIFLNIYQTHQYYIGSIHWDSMTRAAYWDSFLRRRPSERFQGLLGHPDYAKAMQGIYVTKSLPASPPAASSDTLGKEAFIRQAESTIRSTPGWYEHILEKSDKWGKPVDSVIRNDAIWMWEQKKIKERK